MKRNGWTYWRLAADRHAIELHEDLLPPGLALELELHDGGGIAESYGFWRLSQTGALLALLVAGEA